MSGTRLRVDHLAKIRAPGAFFMIKDPMRAHDLS
jgi:hypothetical protein